MGGGAHSLAQRQRLRRPQPMSSETTHAHAAERVADSLGDVRSWSAEALLPAVYDELRRLARTHLAQLAPGQTLQATALVHEAWIRMTGREDPGWECRAHFYGAASRAMRNILVEQSRRKARLKRGGAWSRRDGLELDVQVGDGPPGGAARLGAGSADLLALDEALTRLEALHPLGAQVVSLRFFVGLTVDEVARSLGLSVRRIERAWRLARSWLQREVAGD